MARVVSRRLEFHARLVRAFFVSGRGCFQARLLQRITAF
jgi:hypothetical protein